MNIPHSDKNGTKAETINVIRNLKQLVNSYEKLNIFNGVELKSKNKTQKMESKEQTGCIKELKENVKNCQKCKLSATRTNTVFGHGNINTKLLFVGEAPGFEEDKRGLPFVGRAGMLLTEILNKSNINREEVFITNVIKCRPPENRYPQPDEILNCNPYLKQQIKLIKPKVICTLGACATKTLLNSENSIGSLRNIIHKYENDVLLVATYHPSYCLRNPSAIQDVLKDIKVVSNLLKS